ncbi:hypothetical protein ABTH94_21580, partial [Acinetobacter baumannii]
TIRYSWVAPNPYFVESQARGAPLFLFAPAHYLKTFHPRYQATGSDAAGSWVQRFQRANVMLTNDNVELPSLNPWVLTTPPPA